MSEDLKPCPCCESESHLSEYSDDFRRGTVYSVWCSKCGLHTKDYSKKEEAIKAWNNRPSPWHTGTPTEDGTFIVLWEDTDEQVKRYSKLHFNEYNNTWYDEETSDCNWVDEYHAKVIAWMRVEPYKED